MFKHLTFVFLALGYLSHEAQAVSVTAPCGLPPYRSCFQVMNGVNSQSQLDALMGGSSAAHGIVQNVTGEIRKSVTTNLDGTQRCDTFGNTFKSAQRYGAGCSGQMGYVIIEDDETVTVDYGLPFGKWERASMVGMKQHFEACIYDKIIPSQRSANPPTLAVAGACSAAANDYLKMQSDFLFYSKVYDMPSCPTRESAVVQVDNPNQLIADVDSAGSNSSSYTNRTQGCSYLSQMRAYLEATYAQLLKCTILATAQKEYLRTLAKSSTQVEIIDTFTQRVQDEICYPKCVTMLPNFVSGFPPKLDWNSAQPELEKCANQCAQQYGPAIFEQILRTYERQVCGSADWMAALTALSALLGRRRTRAKGMKARAASSKGEFGRATKVLMTFCLMVALALGGCGKGKNKEKPKVVEPPAGEEPAAEEPAGMEEAMAEIENMKAEHDKLLLAMEALKACQPSNLSEINTLMICIQARVGNPAAPACPYITDMTAEQFNTLQTCGVIPKQFSLTDVKGTTTPTVPTTTSPSPSPSVTDGTVIVQPPGASSNGAVNLPLGSLNTAVNPYASTTTSTTTSGSGTDAALTASYGDAYAKKSGSSLNADGSPTSGMAAMSFGAGGIGSLKSAGSSGAGGGNAGSAGGLSNSGITGANTSADDTMNRGAYAADPNSGRLSSISSGSGGGGGSGGGLSTSEALTGLGGAGGTSLVYRHDAEGPARSLASLGSDDPADYFNRVKPGDSLFQVVHQRYRQTDLEWAREQAGLRSRD